MVTPKQTLANIHCLCAINEEYQPIEWLQFATRTTTVSGRCYIVKQQGSRIELHVQDDEYVLLLWLEGEPAPPMDAIKPQWDTTPMVQSILNVSPDFPQAIAWAKPEKNNDWSSVWLATQWWPMEGLTDAADMPEDWLRWWWQEIMEFTTPMPSMYDIATNGNISNSNQ